MGKDKEITIDHFINLTTRVCLPRYSQQYHNIDGKWVSVDDIDPKNKYLCWQLILIRYACLIHHRKMITIEIFKMIIAKLSYGMEKNIPFMVNTNYIKSTKRSGIQLIGTYSAN